GPDQRIDGPKREKETQSTVAREQLGCRLGERTFEPMRTRARLGRIAFQDPAFGARPGASKTHRQASSLAARGDQGQRSDRRRSRGLDGRATSHGAAYSWLG